MENQLVVLEETLLHHGVALAGGCQVGDVNSGVSTSSVLYWHEPVVGSHDALRRIEVGVAEDMGISKL